MRRLAWVIPLVAVGLGGAFATTGVAAVLLLLVAPRIPDRRRRAVATSVATPSPA